MMRILAGIVVLVGLFGFAPVANADDGDVAVVGDVEIQVGTPFTVRFEVATSADASVEVDPVAESWLPVEVLRVLDHRIETSGNGAVHIFEVSVASFDPGPAPFAPAVTIVDGGESTPRVLTAMNIQVVSVLAAGAPLELSRLPPPTSVGGAESALLWPSVIAGGVTGLLLIAGIGFLLVRRALHAWPDADAAPEEPERPDTSVPLTGAQELLERDPIGAYRIIGQAVRRALTDAYKIPAASMTTDELHRRLEPGVVDSWVARMATDLLSQCDAVVYAGYRPAIERREGDLNVAGEILRAAG